MRNKLFTAAVNKQLANQYKYGSDLSKQKVVAKIFNPYGEGRWYLLNSDPNDPDYIWAIVTMYGNVEIGSVSRRELESLRLTPFRLPLERDIYFDPINAEEVFNGLVGGKFYAKGGGVDSWESLTIEKMQKDFPFSLDKLNKMLRDVCMDRDDAVVRNFQLSWQSKKYDTFANLVFQAEIYLKETGSDSVSPSGTYHSQKGLPINIYLRQRYDSDGSGNITINASKNVAGGMVIYNSEIVNNYSEISNYISLILKKNPKNNLDNFVYAKGGEIKDDSYPSRFQKFIKELEKLSNDTGIAISDTGCIYDNYDNWVSYSNDWTSGDIIPNQGKTRYSKDAPKNWYKFIEELEDISNKNGVEVSITGGVSYNQKNVVYDKDWSSNDLRFTSDDIYAKGGEMAEGGEVNSFYEGQSIILSTDDAYFNRMTKEMKRFTMPFYNKELVIEKIIKDKPYNFAKAFVRETGVKVPFDIKLNERYVQQYAKGGEMAEGGDVEEEFIQKDKENKYSDKYPVITAYNNFQKIYISHIKIPIYKRGTQIGRFSVEGTGDTKKKAFENLQKEYDKYLENSITYIKNHKRNFDGIGDNTIMNISGMPTDLFIITFEYKDGGENKLGKSRSIEAMDEDEAVEKFRDQFHSFDGVRPKIISVQKFADGGMMAKGGVAGYERLVKKVAKNYEGKNVPRKYQSEYGKTYNKEEAKEVGYKVATKVYGMPLAKMKK